MVEKAVQSGTLYVLRSYEQRQAKLLNIMVTENDVRYDKWIPPMLHEERTGLK